MYIETVKAFWGKNEVPTAPGFEYELFSSYEEVEALAKDLMDIDTFALDSETDGVQWATGDRICGISVSYPFLNGKLRNLYIPFEESCGPAHETKLSKARCLEILREPLETKKILTANGTFEIHMFRCEGINLSEDIEDIMIQAYFYWEDRPFFPGLKTLAVDDAKISWAKSVKDFVRDEAKRLADIQGLNITNYLLEYGYSQIAISKIGPYACMDTYLTYKLWEFYNPHIEQYKKRIFGKYSPYEMECRMLHTIARAEARGIKVDMKRLDVVEAYLREEIDKTEKLIQHKNFFNAVFNISSNKELYGALYHFSVPDPEEEEGKYYPYRQHIHENMSMDTEGLAPISELELRDGSICAHVLWIIRYRNITKLLSTYVEPIRRYAGEHGVIHCSMKSIGKVTWRFSCTNPNMQNQPKKPNKELMQKLGKYYPDKFTEERIERCAGLENIRELYVPRPGYVFVSTDYSQQELVILAERCGDKDMRAIFQNRKDFHNATEMSVFGTTAKYDEDGSKVEDGPNRTKAKIINFSVNYGKGAKTLAVDLGVTEGEAAAFLNKLDKAYPGITKYKEALYMQLYNEQIMFNMYGYPRHLERISDTCNRTIREREQRQAVSSDIQGSGAAMIKESLIRLNELFLTKYIDNNNRPAVVLSVHDENVMEVPIELVHEVVPLIEGIMEDVPMSIPIRTDSEVHSKSWAHGVPAKHFKQQQ